ncbi:hypothetical protein [Trinickia sp. EG282A]|uniref:hypothetical protein n=1 Tax=Trinickia sp. EG282A TaxID=3237013 RepID=UPI0034D33E75
MDFPSPLANLGSISSVEQRGARWFFEIADAQAWCCEFSQGLCVAVKLECGSIEDDWLEQASLWLASVRDAIDDAFSLDDDGLWLVRRYEPQLADTEWQALFNQQVAITGRLGDRHRRQRQRANDERMRKLEAWA